MSCVETRTRRGQEQRGARERQERVAPERRLELVCVSMEEHAELVHAAKSLGECV